VQSRVDQLLGALNADGYWPAALEYTSNPYHGPGGAEIVPGTFATTHVGDATDTSPFRDPSPKQGISTATYIENINVLIRWLDQRR
jgi:hypothetical protein